MGTRFKSLLAPVGKATGDGRRFQVGAITNQPLPLPLEWVREKSVGHDGSVVIGAVHTVEITDSAIYAEGEIFDDVDREVMPRLAEDVAEALKLISEGVIGPSVDLDDFEAMPVREGTDDPLEPADWDDEELKIELLITKGRIRAATLVSIPAYVETTSGNFELLDEPDLEALTASVTGSSTLPVADRELPWDSAAAMDRIFEHFTDGENVDTAGIAKAFLYRDPDAAADTKAAYKLGFADVVDGQLQIIPRGVAATAGGRGVDAADIPDAEKDRIKTKICGLYAKVRKEYSDWPECPFDRDEAQHSLVASMAAGLDLVDVSKFTPPVEITGPTPITYDWENGIVYGHIAQWGTCHQGFDNACYQPPDGGPGEYRSFHRYPVPTTDGTLYAGRLTVGGFHPALHLSAEETTREYDAKETVAYLRAHDDEYGIFVCGPICDGLSERTLRVLARRKVSGDWRGTVDGLSMVELLALSPGPRLLSEPGFPVGVHVSRGVQTALVASLGPVPDGEPRRIDYQEIGREIAAALRAEQERQAQRDKIAAELAAMLDRDAEMTRRELVRELGEESAHAV